MSGRMPQIQRSATLQRQPIVSFPMGGGDMEALAAGMDRLANVFAGIGAQEAQQDRQDEQARAIAEAQDEAGRLTVRDPDTGVIQFLEPRDPARPENREFMRTRRLYEDNALEQNARNRAAELAADPTLAGNPTAWQGGWGGYKRTVLDSVPETRRAGTEAMLDRVGGETWRGVALNVAREQRTQSRALFQATLDRDMDDAVGMAEAGGTAGPAWDGLVARYNQRIQAGQEAGYILPEMGDLLRGDLADKVGAIRVGRDIGEIARTRGPQEARRELDARLNSPGAAELGARGLSLARAEGLRRIGVVEQDRSYAQAELKGTLSTVLGSVSGGVTVPVDRLEGYATRAEAAGLTREGGQFRALATIQGEVAAYSSMALPALVTAAAEARAGDPENPVTVMRTDLLGKAVQRRAKALTDDPVGFARSQPLVQAALARAAAGQGSMGDVVRAQDAVLEANGVPSIGHRIVPQAEIDALKEAVTNRPIIGDGTPQGAGAADMLEALFTRYGPENRHRVWNDLRNADLSASLRPVALLLNSPDQRNALRGYLEAQRVGVPALRQTLGSDTAKLVDDAVATALQPLRDTASGTGQDAALMADASVAAGTLALAYAASATPKEAAQRAVREVVDGGLRIVDENLGRFRVPKGIDFDAPAFRTAMEKLLGREAPPPTAAGARMGQRGAAGGFYDDAAAPPGGDTRPEAPPTAMSQVRFMIPRGAVSPDLTPEQQQAQYRTSLAAFGRFRTAPDGSGVWLQDERGRPVLTEDGRPYGIRFGEERDPDGPAVLRPRQQLGSGDAVTDRHQRVFAQLTGAGLSEAAAAGVVANLHHESGVRHDGPAGDGGRSQFIAQWNGPRLAALREFAGQPTGPIDEATQVRFILHEMRNGGSQERRAYAEIQAARTPEEAGEAFSRYYERPAGGDGEARSRGQTARLMLPQLRGRQTADREAPFRRGRG